MLIISTIPILRLKNPFNTILRYFISLKDLFSLNIGIVEMINIITKLREGKLEWINE